jgi:light-regulated signal transduction histidine kinase (bacteriophytochrome)
VLADVLEGLRAPIRESRAIVDTDGLPMIAMHESRLAQVFQNLISNAIKYRGQEHPHIRVTAGLRDGWWVISVTDNGIGIEPQFSEQIFGLFKRLHGQERYPGTGIGLAVCRRIIEHYSGRVWLEESKPDKGSTFCFTVRPAAQSFNTGKDSRNRGRRGRKREHLAFFLHCKPSQCIV